MTLRAVHGPRRSRSRDPGTGPTYECHRIWRVVIDSGRQLRNARSEMTETNPPKKSFCILSMDGGPSVFTYIRFLKVLECERPGFLSRISMLAGSSDGSFAALWLATRAGGRDAWQKDQPARKTLEGLERFMVQVLDSAEPGLRDYVRVVSGLGPMQKLEKTRALLQAEFGTMTLGDIGAKGIGMCVPAYTLVQVDAPKAPKVATPTAMPHESRSGTVKQSLMAKLRSARRKLLRLRSPTPDGGAAMEFLCESGRWQYPDLQAVDAALKSASFPILHPVHNGSVDGGVGAQNPAFAAIAHALENKRHEFDDIVILSLGTDQFRYSTWTRNTVFSANRDGKGPAYLGWPFWILNPFDPLLLLSVIVDGVTTSTNRKAKLLMGERYLRLLAPAMQIKHLIYYVTRQNHKLLNEAERAVNAWKRTSTDGTDPDGKSVTPDLPTTLKWLDEHWFGEPTGSS